MTQEELIQGYFNETLSDGDIKEVRRLLANDNDFSVAFEEYQNVQMAFIHNEKGHLRSYLNSIDDNASTSLYRKLIKNKPLVLAIASCLIIGVFYMISLGNQNDLYNDYFEIYPNVYEPVVRGSNNTDNSDAFQAYENQDFLSAERQFEQLLLANADPNIAFYYAMSLINQSKLSAASKQLNELKEKEHQFLAEVYWYSALIAIKNNDKASAINDLMLLEKTDPEFQAENRLKLLKDLK